MYSLVRKIAFLKSAESAHESVLHMLELLQKSSGGRAILRRIAGTVTDAPVNAMGLKFRHRLGMAAGFDKDARVVIALQELGFSYVEIGTVTPRAQVGNPKPRIWRFPEAHALVNSLGFPSEGMQSVRERLTQLRTNTQLRIPIGINLGKNKETSADDAHKDYFAVFECLFDFGDYFVVNVSSPNTPGLRDLQSVDTLRKILEPLTEFMTKKKVKPLLVKIAPDLADDDAIAAAKLVREMNLAGMVVSNTTIRRDLVPRARELDRGGLSGPPVYARMRELLKIVRGELSSEQTVIAVGGIESAEHVKECLAFGANLVQVYTSFIYLGPRCASKLTC